MECKGARTLAAELTARRHPVSHTKVTLEGEDHPDRDAQFRHINRAVKAALGAGECLRRGPFPPPSGSMKS